MKCRIPIKTFLVLLFLAVCLSAPASDKSNETEDAIPQDSTPVMSDEESARTEEYESNGPEGGREIPMERLPASEIVLACGLLVASSGLAWYHFRTATPGNPMR